MDFRGAHFRSLLRARKMIRVDQKQVQLELERFLRARVAVCSESSGERFDEAKANRFICGFFNHFQIAQRCEVHCE